MLGMPTGVLSMELIPVGGCESDPGVCVADPPELLGAGCCDLGED